MKVWLCWLMLLFSGVLRAQSFTDNLEIKELLRIPSTLAHSSNLDFATNTPVDPLKSLDFTFSPRAIQLDSATPFIAISAAWYETNSLPGNTALSIRFSTNGTAWDNWVELPLDKHFKNGRFTEVTQLIYIDKKFVFYQLQVVSNLLHGGLNVHAILVNFYNPSMDLKACKKSISPLHQRRVTNTSCGCFRPDYLSRPEWNCLLKGTLNTRADTITHIVLHHSEGPNTSIDWKATALSIWNSHTIIFYYGDLGYNWLIDPDGKIYEGRHKDGADAVGYHICAQEDHTIGICMMGTFNDQSISPKARQSLIDLLTWKSCEWNIKAGDSSILLPLGITLNSLAGHAEVCTSGCPGKSLESAMPDLRMAVKSKLSRPCLSTFTTATIGSSNFVFYPNPAQRELYIQNTGSLPVEKISYTIMTSTGRLISSKVINMTANYDELVEPWDQLSPGLYILILRYSGQSYPQKIIKY